MTKEIAVRISYQSTKNSMTSQVIKEVFEAMSERPDVKFIFNRDETQEETVMTTLLLNDKVLSTRVGSITKQGILNLLDVAEVN